MVRIRSLAKELQHLEKKKLAASTPSSLVTHADPEEEEVCAAASATHAAASPNVKNKKVSCLSATQPPKNDSARRLVPPPTTSEETTSASPPCYSSPASPYATGEMSREDQHSSSKSNSNDGDAEESSAASRSSEGCVDAGSSRAHTADKANLFTLGGSRFDILMNGYYGDGAACRKSEVRKATKICANVKVALQRNLEDLMNTTEEEEEQVKVESSASSPAPPRGVSCGIPTRAPFKRLLAQPFSHILVCDFEATCASGSVHYPHEIIEFPVVVLDTATLTIVGEFHRYVKPVRNAKLTAFCTELTGITQETVDQADTLPVVVEQFQKWLEDDIYPLCAAWAKHYGPEKLSHNLKSEQRRFVYDDRTDVARTNKQFEAMICVATDGPWDMRRFMHECSVMRDGIAFPPVCYRYINVRHSFSDHFKCRQIKLTHMLKKMSMSFEGRRHSGIDDTRNITRVLAELMARGYRIHHVSTIKYAHRGEAFLESSQAAQELLSEYGETDQTHTRRKNNTHKGAAKYDGGTR